MKDFNSCANLFWFRNLKASNAFQLASRTVEETP
jgi:hypothetical protein